jgi:hypothetical protein
MLFSHFKNILRLYPRGICKNDKLLVGYYNNKNYYNKKVVLIESNNDILYSKLFLKIIINLRQKVYVDCYAASILGFNSTLHNRKLSILYSYVKSLVINMQWTRVYKINLIKNGFSYNTFNLLDYFRYGVFALRLWSDAKSSFNKEFSIFGIKVGDLIIDSYIKFKPNNKFIINDLFTLYLLFIAIIYLKRTKKLIDHIKPDIYLASYSTYLQHGIPVRLALSCGVDVRLFSNPRNFAKEATIHYPFHTDSGVGYMNLANNNMYLYEKSKERLLERISGKIDNSIIYMKRSAYDSSVKDGKYVNAECVIFLHSFSDNVHCYPDFIFTDFMDWLETTVLILQKLNIKFMIKAHPNETCQGQIAVSEIKRTFGEAFFVPENCDNKKLVHHGLRLGITAYGTVAHELAFLGIPSLSCSHNPHFEFKFNYVAKNLFDYTNFLNNFKKIKFDGEHLKMEACMFYTSHNLVKNNSDMHLENIYTKLHKKLMDKKYDDADILYKLIEDSASYKKFINNLAYFDN